MWSNTVAIANTPGRARRRPDRAYCRAISRPALHPPAVSLGPGAVAGMYTVSPMPSPVVEPPGAQAGPADCPLATGHARPTARPARA